jgi:hypothetical protein
MKIHYINTRDHQQMKQQNKLLSLTIFLFMYFIFLLVIALGMIMLGVLLLFYGTKCFKVTNKNTDH